MLVLTPEQISEIYRVQLSRRSLKALESEGVSLNKPATLYHVRLVNTAANLDDGYIGVTTTGTKERWKAHVRELERKAPVKCSWPTAPVDDFELREFALPTSCQTIEFCLKAEKYLRPKKGMGWNGATGGDWSFSRGEVGWFHSLDNFPKMYQPSESQWAVNFPTFDRQKGKMVHRAITAPRTINRDAAEKGFREVHRKALKYYQSLEIEGAPTPEQMPSSLFKTWKKELGWIVIPGNLFKGAYVFGNDTTGELLHVEAISQSEGARRFGFNLGKIHVLRDTLLGCPKLRRRASGNMTPNKCHAAKYNEGRIFLAAVFDARNNTWTFNNRLSETQRSAILSVNT